MEEFSTELRQESVALYTPSDIVQHSFLVQDSISPLNLELCQAIIVWDGEADSDYPSYSYSDKMINTEEKCRKVYTKNRNLLYTLHLDLPRGRERSLRSESQPKYTGTDDNTILHLAKIFIDEEFYANTLHTHIDYACRYSDDYLKVLRWFIKLDIDKSAFHRLPHSTMNYLFDYMHPGLNDPEFVTECFRKLDLTSWLDTSHSLESGRVSNIFYQFHLNRKEISNLSIEHILSSCLCLPSFKHVGDVLKLKDTPNLCHEYTSKFYLDDILDESEGMIPMKLGNMSLQRQTLLHQAFWVYYNESDDNTTEASEYLRLIWSSVPDSFLTYEEIANAFEDGVDSSEISDIYDFYSKAVGASHPYPVPRTLLHYARTVIRRMLCEKGLWLPDGIKAIGLPRILESYLNLD